MSLVSYTTVFYKAYTLISTLNTMKKYVRRIDGLSDLFPKVLRRVPSEIDGSLHLIHGRALPSLR